MCSAAGDDVQGTAAALLVLPSGKEFKKNNRRKFLKKSQVGCLDVLRMLFLSADGVSLF